MSESASGGLTYAYRAKSPAGEMISGTIDAADLEGARRNLVGLNLEVEEMHAARRPILASPLSAGDFQSFNQQLAQLAGAGLPVEEGLKLVAQEMRRGKLKRAVQATVLELEKGKTLAQAIESQRGNFPPLYSRVIEAGIRSGNLSGILLNLGRHLALTRRLKGMLWQTFSYPVFVMIFFLAMVVFVLRGLLPTMEASYREFHSEQPVVIQLMLLESGAMVWQAKALAVIAAVGVVVWMSLRATEGGRRVREVVLLNIPLIGQILRRNLTSRWCDVTGLGVEAGLDLPAAVDLADDAIASPGLKKDGKAIMEAVESGRKIGSVGAMRILPAIVPAAIELGSERSDLPQTLRSASQIYQQQAEQKLALVPAVLTPILVIGIGVLVGVVMTSLFLPLFSLFRIY